MDAAGVRRLAALVRIELSPAEEAALVGDLERMLGLLARLGLADPTVSDSTAVDADDPDAVLTLEAGSDAGPAAPGRRDGGRSVSVDALRADIPGADPLAVPATELAPERDEGHFLVPRVL